MHHSIDNFGNSVVSQIPGLAPGSEHIDRELQYEDQYGHYRDRPFSIIYRHGFLRVSDGRIDCALRPCDGPEHDADHTRPEGISEHYRAEGVRDVAE